MNMNTAIFAVSLESVDVKCGPKGAIGVESESNTSRRLKNVGIIRIGIDHGTKNVFIVATLVKSSSGLIKFGRNHVSSGCEIH
jgi:hypothetical protein